MDTTLQSNTGSIPVIISKRGADGRLLQGSNLNPFGKPLGAKNFTTKVREALMKVADGSENGETYEVLLIRRVLKKAIVEGDSFMIRLMWNYLDGLPQQSIDLTTKGHALGNLSEEQRTKLDQLLHVE